MNTSACSEIVQRRIYVIYIYSAWWVIYSSAGSGAGGGVQVNI